MLDKITQMVLDLYQPGFRFIESIHPGYPQITGKFVIPKRQYTAHDSKMLSGASSIILITQGLLIGLVDNLYHQKIPKLTELKLDTLEAMVEFCHHTVVCNYSAVKFHNIIWKNDPDNSFEIKFTKVGGSLKKGLVFFYITYSISHGKHQGSWVAAYFREKYETLNTDLSQ